MTSLRCRGLGCATGTQARVPVGQVLTELRYLEYLLVDRHATVEYGADLPVVPYDPTHLAMVFRNLIVNGIRYNREELPVIRIGVTEDPVPWTFSLSDNGIGIAPHEFQKVFMVFSD